MCKHPHWLDQFSFYEKHSESFPHEITKQRAFRELLIDKGNSGHLSQAGVATFLACSMPITSKKGHHHPKARGDKFFDYHMLPTFYVIYLHATKNADLEETERSTF